MKQRTPEQMARPLSAIDGVMRKATKHANSVSFSIEEYVELMRSPPVLLIATSPDGRELWRLGREQLLARFKRPVSAWSPDNFPVYVINR